jgi:archaellum component FlaC
MKERNYNLEELNNFLNHISNDLDLRSIGGASGFLQKLDAFFKDDETHQERITYLSEALEYYEYLEEETLYNNIP